MPRKRNCRRTPKEIQDHETAVKVRKMTDEQLCEFIAGLSASLPSVEDFLRRLDELSGTGNGIGRVTVNKLRRIAIKEGFLEG